VTRIFLIFSFLVIFAISGNNAYGQQTELLSFGSFNTISSVEIGGFDTYSITCNESLMVCEDNIGNQWGFGQPLPDHRIALCSSLFTTTSFNCVHSIEIELQLHQPYADTMIEVQRRRCGQQEIYSNGNLLGRMRGASSGTGISFSVEYFSGLLTPGRPQSFVFTAPLNDQTKCAGGNQIILVQGIAIRGEPISSK
jgi:hypothetical protein